MHCGSMWHVCEPTQIVHSVACWLFDTFTLSNTCAVRAAVRYSGVWLPTDLFTCAWPSVDSVAENCFCHLHCSSLCTSVFERYNQHSDVSVQNACVPSHMYPSLTVTFTNMCHMLSNMSTPFTAFFFFNIYFADRASQYIYVSNKPTWCTKFCFTLISFHASTCFEHHLFIIRKSKLYYTASGIITPIGGCPMHRTATYRCDDTRCCIIQFWPPDDEHMMLETCTGMK